MRRETSIPSLVYSHLFPNPLPTDPPDFQTYLAKSLVAEVRIETQRFYGGLETVEARYPGLNYSHPPHRKRLGRFPHHARLFRSFDELGLTDYEISMLCRWEGTLWARQRYERDEGIKVVDTTGLEIGPWIDRRKVLKRSRRSSPRGIKIKTHVEVEIEDIPAATAVGEARIHQQNLPAVVPQTYYHNQYPHHTRATVNHVNHSAHRAAFMDAARILRTPTPTSRSSSSSSLQPSFLDATRYLVDSAHPSRQPTPTPESGFRSATSTPPPRPASSSSLHLSHLAALAAAASLPRGLPTHVADLNLEAAWEQYLKEQAERGEISLTPAELAAGLRSAALTAAMQNGGPTSTSEAGQAAPPDSMTQASPTMTAATARETTAQ